MGWGVAAGGRFGCLGSTFIPLSRCVGATLAYRQLMESTFWKSKCKSSVSTTWATDVRPHNLPLALTLVAAGPFSESLLTYVHELPS